MLVKQSTSKEMTPAPEPATLLNGSPLTETSKLESEAFQVSSIELMPILRPVASKAKAPR